MSVHKRIKDGRIKLGLTEQQFADRIGVSRGAVQQWEKEGGTAPKRARQPIVAKLLGISEGELMRSSDFAIDQPQSDRHAHGIVIPLLLPDVAPAVETIAQALSQMTEAERELISGKLASLAHAPDSQKLKQAISESLGSPPLPPSKT